MTDGKNTNPWITRLETDATAIYRLSSSLAAVYGDPAGHDLSSVRGLLSYAVAYANRADPADRLAFLLRQAVRGPKDYLKGLHLQHLQQVQVGIQWRHSLERTVMGAVWRHYADVADPAEFELLVATLLSDSRSRRLIGHCGQCRQLFIVQPRGPHEGRPNRLSCGSEKCAIAANAEGSKVRQRKRRTRLQAESILIQKGHGRSATHKAVMSAFKDHPGATADQLAHHAKTLMQSARDHK